MSSSFLAQLVEEREQPCAPAACLGLCRGCTGLQERQCRVPCLPLLCWRWLCLWSTLLLLLLLLCLGCGLWRCRALCRTTGNNVPERKRFSSRCRCRCCRCCCFFALLCCCCWRHLLLKRFGTSGRWGAFDVGAPAQSNDRALSTAEAVQDDARVWAPGTHHCCAGERGRHALGHAALVQRALEPAGGLDSLGT